MLFNVFMFVINPFYFSILLIDLVELSAISIRQSDLLE